MCLSISCFCAFVLGYPSPMQLPGQFPLILPDPKNHPSPSPPCPNVLYHFISWHLSHKSYLTAFTCLSSHQGKLLGITSAKSIVWQRLEAHQIVTKWMSMELIYCGVSVHWGVNLEYFYFSNNCYQLCSIEPSLFLLGSRLP